MAKSRLQITREERIQKLNHLRNLGIDPYPPRVKKDYPNAQILEKYAEFEGKIVSLAGRMMSYRDHGKLAFADLEDQSGKIQVYIRKDSLKETESKGQLGFDHLKLLDVGDFIQVAGEITKTGRGEISILAHEIALLTKTLRPLPSLYENLSDPEIIFRRRYLDLILSSDSREMFLRKSKFWQKAREFMHQKGFIEVETPVLEHVTGGADARPFTTHMNALDQTFFLRISTELYQKRLIGGGFEKIFTLGPNFRNEGLSDEHLTEFTQLEWYLAYADYTQNMELTRELYIYLAHEVYGKTQFTKADHTFDLASDWPKISYPQVIKEKFDVDIFEFDEKAAFDILKENGVKLDGKINKNRLIDNLWKLIRKSISGPAFLIDEPAFMSPLAKSKPEDNRLTQRFHILIAGSELGNGYSELNDPQDQLQRFLDQQAQRDSGDDEAQMLDIDFVEMLEYGMPPTSGFGMSERVFWFLEGVTAREGTLFPALRHKVEPVTREIYGLK